MDDALISLDDQLCFALYGASMAMGRVYKPMLDALGLTYPQYLVLQALWEQDGRTIGGLADRLALESSTITPLVKRLEASGLIVRARNPDDERQVHVTLTDQGRALRSESACLSDRVLVQTKLSLAELTMLTQQIHAVRRALAGESSAES